MKLKCFLKRRNKHLYYIDDTPKHFFILSNKNKNKNFALYKSNILQSAEINWKLIVRHKKSELIEDFLCFKNFIILEIRKKGMTSLVQLDRKTNCKKLIEFNEEVYTVSLANNNNYDAKNFCFIYSSLKTPSCIFSQNLYTKKRRKLWNQIVSNHNEKKYKTRRIFITARDGSKVPISLIYKKGIDLKKLHYCNMDMGHMV